MWDDRRCWSSQQQMCAVGKGGAISPFWRHPEGCFATDSEGVKRYCRKSGSLSHRVEKKNEKSTDSPYRGRICYFDSSSIKVILNPNVFSPEEIASAKVYAVCGVRNNNKFGSTEGYRKAMKMQPSQISGNCNYEYANRPFTDAPFDALSSYQDKMGKKANTQFATETYNGHQYGLFGCGDADYLLEPQYLAGKDAPDMMPAYEVTVTLVVEHKGKPIVYCRTYLPEYKEMCPSWHIHSFFMPL